MIGEGKVDGVFRYGYSNNQINHIAVTCSSDFNSWHCDSASSLDFSALALINFASTVWKAEKKALSFNKSHYQSCKRQPVISLLPTHIAPYPVVGRDGKTKLKTKLIPKTIILHVNCRTN